MELDTQDSLLREDDLDLDEWTNEGMFSSLLSSSLAPRSRSDTDISTASTSMFDSMLVVECFCTFNAALVHIDYPASDNGWVYRPDHGGHSSHRWDLAGDVAIVAKHSTCSKAMRTKVPCRNCEMKKTWRRECKEACNTFFLFALTDAASASAALAPLVLNTVSISSNDVALYTSYAPKIRYQSNMEVDEERVQIMIRRERNLRFSLINGGSGRVRATYRRNTFEEGDLLQLLMEEGDDGGSLVVDDGGSLVSGAPLLEEDKQQHNHLSFPQLTTVPISGLSAPVPLTVPPAPAPAPAISVFSQPSSQPCSEDNDGPLKLSPLHAPRIVTGALKPPSTVVATVISSPSRSREATAFVYDAIVNALVVFDSNRACTVSAAVLQMLLNRVASNNLLDNVAELRDNDAVMRLYAALSISRTPTLLVKSTLLLLWVQKLACTNQDMYLRIGFISMTSVELFDDMRSLPLLPSTLTQGEVFMHNSWENAASACFPETHPILCAYHSPHAQFRVYSPNVLPLAY